MTNDRTATALLVGGNSSRMGEDKSLLICNAGDEPLYIEQLEKLKRISSLPILLSVRPGQDFLHLPDQVVIVPDQTKNQGPLAALVSCLEKTIADYLLILAVDLPQISASYLQGLIDEAEQLGKGIVPRHGKHWEPLVAVYPLSLLPKAKEHLKAGQLSLRKFINEALAEGFLVARDISPQEEPLFSNLNTPEDLQSLKHKEYIPADIQRWQMQPKENDNLTHSNISDLVALEEPVELRVEGRSVAVLMRTPGHDRELAAGFLFSENVIHHVDDLFEISECQNVESNEPNQGMVVDVLFKNASSVNLEKLSRHVFTSSSCGLCGKATIDSVFQTFPPLSADNLKISATTLLSLPAELTKHQKSFHHTGGLHASALFTPNGKLQIIREDVGRHNALDKVIGNALLEQATPLANTVLLLSGRISFELMQKALAAGIPFVAGISAPSSLAVKFAQQSGQTLIGFLRQKSFNVYAGEQRLSNI
ncbi:MAG: formate dehydrogenase accessory sulfurtransferase FdhD, partial [Verrucomicrobia bacterium]|nr:formate dehydrogenase accessory sulfurtransferase FdhD [Verrucomicrobiota bacterium]